jgi:hypothetical protein
MTLHQLRSSLETNPDAFPRFLLPDGDLIPAHAHVTEVGHVTKRFIDCGGEIGQQESVVLQTWVGDDTEHRLTADRFAKILQLGERVLPSDDFPVEVEYDCCVVAQYPIEGVEPNGDHLDILLGSKRTQCLARERRLAGETAACC